MFGVFRVKNHDFTPKNHIFSNTPLGYNYYLWLLKAKIKNKSSKIRSKNRRKRQNRDP